MIGGTFDEPTAVLMTALKREVENRVSCDRNHRRRSFQAAMIALSFVAHSAVAQPSDAGLDLFESRVRPLFIERCQECHGPDKQSSSLRLDSRESVLNGGDTGPAIVPGKPGESLLLSALRQDGDVSMPPDDKLAPDEIDAVARWIELGAPWPASAERPVHRARDHWAFQPPVSHPIPSVTGADWPRGYIDSFVLTTLEERGLTPSPPADRRTLARRTAMDLTGLLPDDAELDPYLADSAPDAFERLVDRYLASPHHGEAWGRHWLDVARYADTKGYVYAREERVWVHAWTYRDWVVRALNEDMPYDRFLLLQVAADQVADQTPDLAALGFLTLGRRFLGVRRDVMDDRIDVVCRGTMGLTVGCARCHDHKFDPISTEDYYSLYGVFDNAHERLVRLSPEESADAEFEKGLRERQEQYRQSMATRSEEAAQRVRARIKDYLLAQFELEKYPEEGFDVVIEPDDVVPSTVRYWRDYLERCNAQNDPVFAIWNALFPLPSESFSDAAAEKLATLLASSAETVNPIIAAAFQTPPTDRNDLADRHATVFATIDRQWQELVSATPDTPPHELPDPHAEALRRVLYGEDAPCEPPNEPVVHNEFFFTTNVCNELWKLQGDVDRWIIKSPAEVPFALALYDRKVITDAPVLRRGNPRTPGPKVPRQFLTLLHDVAPEPFSQGSGRRELAQAIIHPQNPLTARVIVNRLWTHHFGKGIVRTPSDFGTRAESPSHPELLDELATRLTSDGWSLKQFHRDMVTSATYRQSSTPSDPDALARALDLDPDNRLLWRGRSHRLSFEEWRDAALRVTGELDLAVGGKSADLFANNPTKRRALYGTVDRQYLPAVMRIFDFANPDLHIPQRSETIVPQQALFFMNHPFVIDRARSVTKDITSSTDVERLREIYRRVLGRDPTPAQSEAALALVHAEPTPEPLPESAQAWSYGFGGYDEAKGTVIDFTPLPFFTGDAWQGGAVWPDPSLGWPMLSAQGGHAGNDRAHAVVRRWTAPRDITIRVESTIQHSAKPGDGVRAFLVADDAGFLASAAVHQAEASLRSEPFKLTKGQHVDFVVDLDEQLNHDEFDCEITIQEIGEGNAESWNSKRDFAGHRTDALDPWQQLAQVLLVSNEFLFLD